MFKIAVMMRMGPTAESIQAITIELSRIPRSVVNLLIRIPEDA